MSGNVVAPCSAGFRLITPPSCYKLMHPSQSDLQLPPLLVFKLCQEGSFRNTFVIILRLIQDLVAVK